MSTARLTRAEVAPRAYWWDAAACRGKSYSLFFGSEEVPLVGAAAEPGRAVCRSCPVRRDCLADALLTGEIVGLRGGFLGHERSRTLRRLGGDVVRAMAAFDAGVFYPTKGLR